MANKIRVTSDDVVLELRNVQQVIFFDTRRGEINYDTQQLVATPVVRIEAAESETASLDQAFFIRMLDPHMPKVDESVEEMPIVGLGKFPAFPPPKKNG